MKVLFASLRNPHTHDDGLTLYTRHLIEVLEAVDGIEVRYWFPQQPQLDRPRSLSERARLLLTHQSRIVQIYRMDLVRELEHELDEGEIDLVFFNHIVTAWLAGYISSDVRKVYVAHNAEYLSSRSTARLESGLNRLSQTQEARGRASIERHVLTGVSGLVVLSHLDAERLGLLSPRVARMPQAVIPPAFEIKHPRTEARSHTVLLLGSFGWPVKRKNARWLAKDVIPLVRNEVTDARLLIAGHHAHVLRDLEALPWVEIKSDPGDVAPLWSESAVCAVPERQLGGVKLKVLDAVGHGVPVVSTRPGVEGTHLVPGRSCLVGETANQFADHLISVMNSADKGRALARNAALDMSTYPTFDEKRRRIIQLIDMTARSDVRAG